MQIVQLLEQLAVKWIESGDMEGRRIRKDFDVKTGHLHQQSDEAGSSIIRNLEVEI